MKGMFFKKERRQTDGQLPSPSQIQEPPKNQRPQSLSVDSGQDSLEQQMRLRQEQERHRQPSQMNLRFQSLTLEQQQKEAKEEPPQNLQKNESQEQKEKTSMQAQEASQRKIQLAIQYLNGESDDNKKALLNLYRYLVIHSELSSEGKDMLKSQKVTSVLSISISPNAQNEFFVQFDTEYQPRDGLSDPLKYTMKEDVLLHLVEKQLQPLKDEISKDRHFFDFKPYVNGKPPINVREFIEELFKDKPWGQYLLRFSSTKPNTLVVSCKWKDKIQHMEISIEGIDDISELDDIKNGLFEDFNKNNPMFQLGQKDQMQGFVNQSNEFLMIAEEMKRQRLVESSTPKLQK